MLRCLAADAWWAAQKARSLSRGLSNLILHSMDETRLPQRSELLQQLQALTQNAAADDSLPLPHLADQLTALADRMRVATSSNATEPPSAAAPVSALTTDGGGDAGPHAAAAAATAMDACEGDAAGDGPGGQPKKKQRRAPREFDFSRYRTRYVALELMYVGWDYQGFARQDNTEKTIEGVFFAALRKVKLIPEAAATPISELNYSRCGRTDRGVSALGQVVALRLRSCARVDEPEAAPDAEFDYPRLVNKALPPEVRVLGWAPVAEDFNARFSAQYREYKYFIVRQRLGPPPGVTSAAAAADGAEVAVGAAGEAAGSRPADADGASASGSGAATEPASGAASASCAYSLDIEAMRAAAARFVGEHDFRNFCKADVASVRSFRRRILSFTIDPVSTSAADGGHQVFALTVRGTAFLWHQVRCMAAVLLMVGRGQERPDVVSALLDLEATPRKPQYSMAPEEPLLLYGCGFSGLAFRRSAAAVDANLVDVGGMLHRLLERAALTAACHSRLAADERGPPAGLAAAACAVAAAAAAAAATGRGGGGGGGGGAPHIPLLKRQTEPSIEERMSRRGLPWPPPEAGAGAGAREGGQEDEEDLMME